MLGVMMVMRRTMIIGVDAVRDLKMILWRCIGGFKTLPFISDQYQLDDPLDVPLALEGALKQLTIHSFWVMVKLVCFGCNPDWGFRVPFADLPFHDDIYRNTSSLPTERFTRRRRRRWREVCIPVGDRELTVRTISGCTYEASNW